MKNMLAPAAILAALWAGSATAQSAIGGPKKQNNLGGPTVQKNPVVRATQSVASTLPSSPPKQSPRK